MKTSRREFLAGSISLLAIGCDTPKISETKQIERVQPAKEIKMNNSTKMPVLFVGHGSPMHVIQDNQWSRGFKSIANHLPRPKAILSISAHWYVNGTYLTASESNKTIHDFGGFPQEMYEIQYPAPGAPSLAKRVTEIIERAELSYEWGLDHGTWTVLHYVFPDASVPVIQLSIDRRMEPKAHYELAKDLKSLREEGVLIFGTGNITHNLRAAFGQMRSGDPSTPEYSAKFDAEIRTTLENRDFANLWTIIGTEHGRLSHPTLDHYLPLLYCAAALDESDQPTSLIEGFDHGLSMRSVLWT